MRLRDRLLAHPVNQVAFILAVRETSTDDLQQNHSERKRVALNICVFVLRSVPATERGFVVEVAERLLMFRKQHFPALKVDQLSFCFTKLVRGYIRLKVKVQRSIYCHTG